MPSMMAHKTLHFNSKLLKISLKTKKEKSHFKLNFKLTEENFSTRFLELVMEICSKKKKFSVESLLNDFSNESQFPCIRRYVPKVTSRNNDKAKQQLQERMSGLKEYPELQKLTLNTKDKHRKNGNKIHSNDRIAELLNEIYERIEWLKEMNELGEGKKHRQVIDAQVTERLREIKRIEEKIAKEKRDGLQDSDEGGD